MVTKDHKGKPTEHFTPVASGMAPVGKGAPDGKGTPGSDGPRWTVTIIHDSGPSLRFSYAKMRCWQDREWWQTDLNCGDHSIGSPSVSRYNRTWTSNLI